MPVNTRQTLAVQGMHGAIVVIVVLSATALAYAGKIDSAAVMALLGAAVAFAGGSAQSVGMLAQTVNGKSVVSSSALADREATIRTALNAAAAAPAHFPEPTEPTEPEG